MASSTTNLGLRKPAVSENWSVQDDFNANMDKIDAYVGKHNLGSFATLSALEDALNALGATMKYGECLDIYFTMTAAVGLFAATGYIGRIMKVLNAVRYRVIVYQNGGNLEFDGVQWGGTSWSWDRLALNSQLPKIIQLTKTVNNGFFSISSSEIPFGKKLIIQNAYVSSNNSSDLTFAVQSNSSGSAAQYYVYVRKNGAIPANDTSVTVNILYI